MRNRDEPRRVKRKHLLKTVVAPVAGIVGPLDEERLFETLDERRPLLATPHENGVVRPYTVRKDRA